MIFGQDKASFGTSKVEGVIWGRTCWKKIQITILVIYIDVEHWLAHIKLGSLRINWLQIYGFLVDRWLLLNLVYSFNKCCEFFAATCL